VRIDSLKVEVEVDVAAVHHGDYACPRLGVGKQLEPKRQLNILGQKYASSDFRVTGRWMDASAAVVRFVHGGGHWHGRGRGRGQCT
jgi:hypothetical protein